MTPEIVVDIGNSRIKWGRFDLLDTGPRTVVSLPADSPSDWNAQLAAWNLPRVQSWAVASVHPERLKHFLDWIHARGENVLVINHYQQLQLSLKVDVPEAVGIDRLLNALAARSYVPHGTSALIIDVGTAVTVDWLDEQQTFRGGAILPGPRLMFESLHQHTAKLPLITEGAIPEAQSPGTNTRSAMMLGVRAAQIGALQYLVREYSQLSSVLPYVFLTGGAVGSISRQTFPGISWVARDSTLTLQGIQLAAESLPDSFHRTEGLS